jgi:carbonic anhydrase
MPNYNQVFENNKNWIAEKKASDADFFNKLSAGQDPDYLYIGCSDSRVTAEEMMGMKPGEVFVHRNIANVISNSDINCLSVINYSVINLQVKHIVVCGHYYCGGIKAAMEPTDLGLLNPWLRNIRDIYRLHQEEISEIDGEDEKYKRLVELNAIEQSTNVLKTAAVQQSFLKTGYPKVHAWIFDVKTGRLIDLNFDYQKKLEEIQEIYDLGLNK